MEVAELAVPVVAMRKVMLEDDLRTRREIPDAIRQTLAARDGAVQE